MGQEIISGRDMAWQAELNCLRRPEALPSKARCSEGVKRKQPGRIRDEVMLRLTKSWFLGYRKNV